jgi:hypothetical protein
MQGGQRAVESLGDMTFEWDAAVSLKRLFFSRTFQ